jgi:hypothetical protein
MNEQENDSQRRNEKLAHQAKPLGCGDTAAQAGETRSQAGELAPTPSNTKKK